MIGWIDASSGASGDMLLGALLDAGAEEDFIRGSINAVAPEQTTLSLVRAQRGSLWGNHAFVEVADSNTRRGLGDVVALITAAKLQPEVKRNAIEVFSKLGAAEAAVHGVSINEVHFHEVGALDAIADIVGVCAGFVSLGLSELICSPVAVGSGTVSTNHGEMSIPPPAVVAMLRGAPTYAGQIKTEMCTPTGAALLSHWVTSWGAQPMMTVDQIGTGCGTKDFDNHANVIRIFLGVPHEATLAQALLYETNIDDLDPRLWPSTLQRLLDSGASDAWLTPIIMKKGRPAYTLSVLLKAGAAVDIRQVIFTETSAIGLRETYVGKHELDRQIEKIEVDDRPIGVKLALTNGHVVNVQPEYEDVAAAAKALERPLKAVMADAIAASAHFWER
ncbi:MAG: nickel pincer cofactor biosynthesis protein LarC [Nocardioidaceae bacterium]